MLIHLSSRPDNTTQHRSQTKPVQLQKEKTSTTHSCQGRHRGRVVGGVFAWLDGQEREQRICQNRSTDASASDWISKAELEDLAAARGSIRRARLDLSRGDEDSVNNAIVCTDFIGGGCCARVCPERHGSCVVALCGSRRRKSPSLSKTASPSLLRNQTMFGQKLGDGSSVIQYSVSQGHDARLDATGHLTRFAASCVPGV